MAITGPWRIACIWRSAVSMTGEADQRETLPSRDMSPRHGDTVRSAFLAKRPALPDSIFIWTTGALVYADPDCNQVTEIPEDPERAGHSRRGCAGGSRRVDRHRRPDSLRPQPPRKVRSHASP